MVAAHSPISMKFSGCVDLDEQGQFFFQNLSRLCFGMGLNLSTFLNKNTEKISSEAYTEKINDFQNFKSI